MSGDRPHVPTRRGRLLMLTVGLALVAVSAASCASAPAKAPLAAPSPAPHFRDGHGLHVLSMTRFDARDYNVEVLSGDLGRPINIRLLLPVDYAAHPSWNYPALYLFHGTSGVASDWIRHGNAEPATAPLQLITVMPEVGFNGDGGFWFTNWVDKTTSHGPSQFEDYLMNQLVPWVDQNLRTIPTRAGRAVAGLSQGGYGSAEMAARHPDTFTSMATFSGAPEIERDPKIFTDAIGIIDAIEIGDDHVPADAELGNPKRDLINWQGHDPATLITNLRGMSIDMWTGEGKPGPYDPPTPDPSSIAIEKLTYASTSAFHQHLVAESVPSYYDDYVNGTHTFPYWARDLREYLPMMMADFAHPKKLTSVSYMSIDKQWSQWGYTVSLDRAAPQQFSSLTGGTKHGFSLSGTGTAVVTTPAAYRPGSTLTVHVTEPTGTTRKQIKVSANGRLTLTLHLGHGGSATVAIPD